MTRIFASFRPAMKERTEIFFSRNLMSKSETVPNEKSGPESPNLILAARQAALPGVTLVHAVVSDNGGIPPKVCEICIHALDGPASTEGQPSSFATATSYLVEYKEGTAAAFVKNLQRHTTSIRNITLYAEVLSYYLI